MTEKLFTGTLSKNEMKAIVRLALVSGDSIIDRNLPCARATAISYLNWSPVIKVNVSLVFIGLFKNSTIQSCLAGIHNSFFSYVKY